MKKMGLLAAVLALCASQALAGVGILWVTAVGGYSAEADPAELSNIYSSVTNALLYGQGATWQLVYAGPDGQIDPPDLSNAANGWAGGDDVVWAVRTVAQGGGTAPEDGTAWDVWLTHQSGGPTYEDLSWTVPGHVYQRVYQGAPGVGTWYYDSPLRMLNVGYGGAPHFPQMFIADTDESGFQPNRQISGVLVDPAVRSVGFASGTGTFAVAVGEDRTYAATANAAWLSVVSGGTGTNAGTLAVAYEANTGVLVRTGTVTVASTGQASAVATIVQQSETTMKPFGGAVVGRRPTFEWRPTAGATWYLVHLNRNGQKQLEQWVDGASTWTPSADLPAGSYQWWVRPWSPGTGNGAWSSGATFVVPQARPTVAPTPVGPQGTQAVGARRPEFSWSAVSNATWYRVYATRGGQVAIDRWVETTSYVPPADLPAGTYRWWVVGWGPDGLGPWSAERSFVLPLAVPGAPSQTAPQGPQGSNNLAYAWTKDALATWYNLWVGRAGGGVLHNRWFELSGAGQANVNPGAAVPGPAKPAPTQPVGAIAQTQPTFRWDGGNCQWYVRGWSADGNGPWAGPMDFSVPYAPNTWMRVYVTRGGAFVFDQWTQAVEFSAPAPLQAGAHSWWLGVWDAPTGRTVWSDRIDFVVQP